jgi:hypothetical protein
MSVTRLPLSFSQALDRPADCADGYPVEGSDSRDGAFQEELQRAG